MGQYLYEIFCILPFLVCLLWSIILGIDSRHKGRAVKVLWQFSIACTLLYFCHSLHFSSTVLAEPGWSRCLYLACNLAVYPLFYLYIRSLTSTRIQKRLFPLLLVPSAVIAVTSCLLVILSSSTHGPGDFDELELVGDITAIIFAVEVALTGIFGIRDLGRYRRKVANFYTDTEERAMPALNTFFILFIITAIISMGANLIGKDFFKGKLLLAVPSVLFSSFLFGIFHWGYKCRYGAADMAADIRAGESMEDKPAHEDLTQQDVLFSAVCDVMERKMLFLQPDLKITDLLPEVGSNRTYISNCINRKSGKSFSEFVHSYRINHAISLMQKGENSLSEIAVLSGYLDGNAFYKAFSRRMGMSPSAWLETLQRKGN